MQPRSLKRGISSIRVKTLRLVKHPFVSQDSSLYPDQLIHMSLFASPFGFPHLPDLQEISIRVMEEGPSLVAPFKGRGEKLGSPRAQDLVSGRAVGNLNAQFTDDALAVGWRRIGRGRLVGSGTKGRRQENLASGKAKFAEGPGKLTQNSRSQHIAIERQ